MAAIPQSYSFSQELTSRLIMIQRVEDKIFDIQEAFKNGCQQTAALLAKELGIINLYLFRGNDTPSPADDQRYNNSQFRKSQAEKMFRLIDEDPQKLVDPDTGEALTIKERIDIQQFCAEELREIKRERYVRERLRSANSNIILVAFYGIGTAFYEIEKGLKAMIEACISISAIIATIGVVFFASCCVLSLIIKSIQK
jgi:hypothetical protein